MKDGPKPDIEIPGLAYKKRRETPRRKITAIKRHKIKSTTTKNYACFPNLKYMRIVVQLAWRFANLSGKATLAEWLPASLKELEIVGYGLHLPHITTDQVVEVVRRRETILPNLKILKGVDEHILKRNMLAHEDEHKASDQEVESRYE